MSRTGGVTAAVRRLAVTVAGVSLIALGTVLMVLPGPGLVVVGAGLAVLATEYPWARRVLAGLRRRFRRPGGGSPRPAGRARE